MEMINFFKEQHVTDNGYSDNINIVEKIALLLNNQ